ncbi:MAG: hypothetical protein AAFP19_17035, partial [Bacteroidota bacterium]
MSSNKLLLLSLPLLLLAACEFLQNTQEQAPQQDTLPPEVSAPEGNAVFEQWLHSPLHPVNGQAVTFQLKAAEAKGILQVELYVFEYELYKNAEGLPSKRRRVNGQWGLLQKWEYGGEQQELMLS